MKLKPILYRSPMVRAILEDRKTITRRTQGLEKVNEAPDKYSFIDYGPSGAQEIRAYFKSTFGDRISAKPKYQVGDVMWVRETWCPTRFDYLDMLKRGIKHFVKYKADRDFDPKKDLVGRSWKPSIHMPKLACRIYLEVTSVKVERLLDVSEEDAIAEGIENHYLLRTEGYKHYTRPDKFIPFKEKDAAITSFLSLWMSINGAESLDANPWVWAYEFKRIEKPEQPDNV